jgi:hypothetical protein
MKKEFWFCYVGPVASDTLPSGADSPLRRGVSEGIERLNLPFNTTIGSGWGVTQDQLDRIQDILHENYYPKKKGKKK